MKERVSWERGGWKGELVDLRLLRRLINMKEHMKEEALETDFLKTVCVHLPSRKCSCAYGNAGPSLKTCDAKCVKPLMESLLLPSL